MLNHTPTHVVYYNLLQAKYRNMPMESGKFLIVVSDKKIASISKCHLLKAFLLNYSYSPVSLSLLYQHPA